MINDKNDKYKYIKKINNYYDQKKGTQKEIKLVVFNTLDFMESYE